MCIIHVCADVNRGTWFTEHLDRLQGSQSHPQEGFPSLLKKRKSEFGILEFCFTVAH